MKLFFHKFSLLITIYPFYWEGYMVQRDRTTAIRHKTKAAHIDQRYMR